MCAGQEKGLPRNPSGALAVGVRLRVREHKTCIVSGLQSCCRITTAPNLTQHPRAPGRLSVLIFQGFPSPLLPISVFFSGPFSLLTNPKPSSQPHLVYKIAS